jgi:PQQ-dependent dehydrogenase (s-GDH family)
MKRLIALAAVMLLTACSSDQPQAPSATAGTEAPKTGPDAVVTGELPFEMTVVTTGLRGPWEITWGPDGYLWVTERIGKRIVRVNPADGSKTTAIQIDEAEAPGGQDGLLGLALHPELLTGTGNDYVYTAYQYEDDALPRDETVTDTNSPYANLFTKIVRLTYDEATGTLSDPVALITGMPASNDHNSGRMKIGLDGKLYYTIGDGGNDQLGNWCIPIESQRLPTSEEVAAKNWFAYQGKSLRFNLDGSIPDDNPEIKGVRSHVFTYGHRNMQGIDFGPDGTLYASEQGPKSDDEVNILTSGGNYGWPNVVGYRDDLAYQYARWKDAELPCELLMFSDIVIHDSVPRANETEFTEEMVDPIQTLFTVPDNYDFTNDQRCDQMYFICWPTVAASSIEVYDDDAIPGWKNSLLVTALKLGSIYRIPLAEDGKTVSGPPERYFRTQNRYRDTAVSPDGKTIYVATDAGGLGESLEGRPTTTMKNGGVILAFTYGGEPTAAATPAADTPAEPATETAEVTAPAPAATGIPPTFTAAQAESGKVGYDAHCVTCHGPVLAGGNYGTPLSGEYFAANWVGKSVGALYVKVRDTMPPSEPGSLAEETYAAIVAYVLEFNGVRPGEAELPPAEEQLNQMMIPPTLK